MSFRMGWDLWVEWVRCYSFAFLNAVSAINRERECLTPEWASTSVWMNCPIRLENFDSRSSLEKERTVKSTRPSIYSMASLIPIKVVSNSPIVQTFTSTWCIHIIEDLELKLNHLRSIFELFFWIFTHDQSSIRLYLTLSWCLLSFKNTPVS